METLTEMRANKDRPKDPVYLASGRLSHAVRVNADPEVIDDLRRELATAQVAKYLGRVLAEVPPTKEQAASLCKLIRAAAAA